MSRFTKVLVSTVAWTLLAGLVLAGTASATTWCVPEFHAACADNGSNVQEPSLDFAMKALGNDGESDRVLIAPGTISFPGSLTPAPAMPSSDPLEVTGAGAGQTRLTSSTGGNIIVVNLAGTNFFRKVTMRDLTIVVPPQSGGFSSSGIQTSDDIFERVNFESLDPSASGSQASAVGNILDGGEFRDVKIFGTAGGRFANAFNTGNSSPGDELVITGTEVSNSATGITGLANPVLPVSIRRSHFQVNGQVLNASGGDQVTVENSVIEAGQFTPFYATTLGSGSSSLTLRNNTIVSTGGAETAVSSTVGPAATGSTSVTISDSIIVGFTSTWELEAPVSGSLGDADFELTYSNVSSAGTKTGDGTFSATLGVINETPLFEGFNDYRLTPDSPSIDSGNPAPGGTIEDFEGNPRPLDGDGDDSDVRDQGAFEAPAVFTCLTVPTLCPDETAPRITRIRFAHGRSPRKGGSLRMRVNEACAIKAVFRPIPATRGKRKRKTVSFSRTVSRTGAVSILIRKGKLQRGRYRLTIKAVDGSGNRSRALVRKIRVR